METHKDVSEPQSLTDLDGRADRLDADSRRLASLPEADASHPAEFPAADAPHPAGLHKADDPHAARRHEIDAPQDVSTVLSRAPLGLAAPLVRVEVHLGSGLPAFAMVGLPEAVVRESKERVRSALMTSGFEFPNGRITVNLSPADLPKEGCRFDLPHCHRHTGRQQENTQSRTLYIESSTVSYPSRVNSATLPSYYPP